jgi:hypothetical protein
MKKLLLLGNYFAAMTAMLLSGCAFIHPTDPYAPIGLGSITPLDHPQIPQATGAQQPTLQGPLTLAEGRRVARAHKTEISAPQWDL